ncbi:hypothetical protein Poly51_39750 [Rubripirellula tenax]|uniref:Uncharacterized protein n=2 Tax=Rubripirellula tenax TaxID=2528015 RepID=A0A5C6ENQ5_9BACT|nr:hypothetical protein Poly51_39750 [Rubripirellula tenax]
MDGSAWWTNVVDDFVIRVETPVEDDANSATADFGRQFGWNNPRGTPNRFGDADEFGASYRKQTIVPNQIVSNGELFVSGSNAQHAVINNVPNERTTVVVK